MKRREFIAGLSGSAAAWPLAARAQQAKMPVIGLLIEGGSQSEGVPEGIASFIRGLAEVGFVEGRNVAIEYRWENSEPGGLRDLAADLARRRVAVIVAPGSIRAALAAKAATTTIPIAFSMGGDPVQVGLVASLARPGGNITGFTELNPDVLPKRLALLYALVPQAARFGLLVNPRNRVEGMIGEAKMAADSLGRPIDIFTATTTNEIDTSFVSAVEKRVDALLITGGALAYQYRSQIIALAARLALPAAYWDRGFPLVGGLMSYGTSTLDSIRQAGIYTGRILKGEKPADMPVMQATKFEFVLNLKTANALGLTVPPNLLAIADEVIE
jgi:putative tryptophan/tyrosine transport system substrate-binding protein